MKSYTFPQKINSKIQALAIYQIAGGIIGLYLTLKLMSTLSQIPNLIIFLFFIAICLYCYSILCGIFIFAKKDRELKYSLINQYLQLINFAILGYSFKYASGVYLFVGLDLTDLVILKFNIGISTWRINFNIDDDLTEINLNLVSLFVIIFIHKIKKTLNEAHANNILEEISN